MDKAEAEAKARDVLQHFIDEGISPDDLATEAGLGWDRMRNFLDGGRLDDDELLQLGRSGIISSLGIAEQRDLEGVPEQKRWRSALDIAQGR